jgi:hypothetical protein
MREQRPRKAGDLAKDLELSGEGALGDRLIAMDLNLAADARDLAEDIVVSLVPF